MPTDHKHQLPHKMRDDVVRESGPQIWSFWQGIIQPKIMC